MYGVYVVEQDGKTPFNRAMLMNVGAAEAVKQQVFIFMVLWLCFTFRSYWFSINFCRSKYTDYPCIIDYIHDVFDVDSHFFN